MTPQLYIQVFINGDERNLPEKEGNYFIHWKGKFIITNDSECYIGYTEYNQNKKTEWLKEVDWYLIPSNADTIIMKQDEYAYKMRTKRPNWCPHTNCICDIQIRNKMCIGKLPIPEPHESDFNTHRFCLDTREGEPQAAVFDLQINKIDAWNFVRLLNRVK